MLKKAACRIEPYTIKDFAAVGCIATTTEDILLIPSDRRREARTVLREFMHDYDTYRDNRIAYPNDVWEMGDQVDRVAVWVQKWATYVSDSIEREEVYPIADFVEDDWVGTLYKVLPRHHLARLRASHC